MALTPGTPGKSSQHTPTAPTISDLTMEMSRTTCPQRTCERPMSLPRRSPRATSSPIWKRICPASTSRSRRSQRSRPSRRPRRRSRRSPSALASRQGIMAASPGTRAKYSPCTPTALISSSMMTGTLRTTCPRPTYDRSPRPSRSPPRSPSPPSRWAVCWPTSSRTPATARCRCGRSRPRPRSPPPRSLNRKRTSSPASATWVWTRRPSRSLRRRQTSQRTSSTTTSSKLTFSEEATTL
mmetsp:Transcript_25458/g.71537  ORF Transcript_25458/g.71537 Transcript_25458/m.71537 type:complete len:239 (-) Transcript_25458:289-1005(-)